MDLDLRKVIERIANALEESVVELRRANDREDVRAGKGIRQAQQDDPLF